MAVSHRAAILLVVAISVSAACSGGEGDRSEVATRRATASTSSVAPAVEGPTTTLDAPASTTSVTAPSTTVGRRSATRPQASAPAAAPTAPPPTDPPSTTTPPPPPEPAATTTTAPGASATITIANFTYVPPALQVARGTTVTATNDDAATHTWTSDDDAWDSGDLRTGEHATHRFDEPGTYTYHCAIHPSMKGSVNVSG